LELFSFIFFQFFGLKIFFVFPHSRKKEDRRRGECLLFSRKLSSLPNSMEPPRHSQGTKPARKRKRERRRARNERNFARKRKRERDTFVSDQRRDEKKAKPKPTPCVQSKRESERFGNERERKSGREEEVVNS